MITLACIISVYSILKAHSNHNSKRVAILRLYQDLVLLSKFCNNLRANKVPSYHILALQPIRHGAVENKLADL